MKHASRLGLAAALAITLAALAASCGGAVDGAVDAATVDAGSPNAIDAGSANAVDAGSPDARPDATPDAGFTDRCAAPCDCAALGAPLTVSYCKGSSWSCVLGRCTWECRGGRTCTRDAGGCLACDRGGGALPERSCPGDVCVEGLLPRDGGGGSAEATCARAFLVDVTRCEGEDVALRTGETCTLQSLFTGAPRGVLQCGPCQTVLGP